MTRSLDKSQSAVLVAVGIFQAERYQRELGG